MIVRLLLSVVVFCVVMLLGCSPPPPACPPRQDDPETPLEAKQGDACHRAGVNLAVVCPRLWRKDWDDFCHTMVDTKVPLCPVKLAKVKSCAEADKVCR